MLPSAFMWLRSIYVGFDLLILTNEKSTPLPFNLGLNEQIGMKNKEKEMN